ncbi:hypothetical protein EMG21_26235 [Klebsiella pneumoniae]|nr:hypothetical protein EMG21_26235 [Klebsiella pneumoniae]
MTEVMKYTYAELEAEIRVVEQDGEPWFVLTDLAKVLGYRDAANAKRVLRDGQYNTLPVSISADLGFSRGRSPIVINEPGLYRLIMRSNVPNAEKFQDWVTGEVLPTIRKTGAYIDPASALAESVARGDIDTLLELAQASVNAAKEARAELKVVRPKAALFDAAMAYEDQGGMPLQNFARCLAAETGWKTRQLLQQFVTDGFLGYDESKSRYFIGEGKGELFNSHTGNPLVTMKGVEAICDFYGLKG